MSLEARVGPPIAEAETARIALELYGVEASAQALPGEYDDNFHLTGTDGREYVLKVMHPARERSFIDMQCQVLRHLAQRAPHLRLPRVLPDHDGELFSTATFADGMSRLVWLLTFVKGTVLAKVRPHGRNCSAIWAAFLARWMPRCIPSRIRPRTRN
jgi:Ser/Thr protein kinase RdoA (MazF antagonist)